MNRILQWWLNLKAWFRAWFNPLEQVLEPVPENVVGLSTPSSVGEPQSEPVPCERLSQRPPPDIQAQALLEWLHTRYAGETLRASEVERIAYKQMIKAKGWRSCPWDGRHGVGKFLRENIGGKAQFIYWPDANGVKEKVRVYKIPMAIVVRKRA